jgi:hypothetical protein
MGKELKISLKGISSLPSLKDVQKKMASGKMTPRFELMSPAVGEVDDFLDSGTYKKAADQDGLFKQWLGDKLTESKKGVRKLLYEMAQIRFSIVVGQTWFNEFATVEEGTLDIDGVTATVEAKEQMRSGARRCHFVKSSVERSTKSPANAPRRTAGAAPFRGGPARLSPP